MAMIRAAKLIRKLIEREASKSQVRVRFMKY